MTRREELERIIELKRQRLDQLQAEKLKLAEEILTICHMIAELDNASTRQRTAA
jgi:hypothetical protein